MDIITAFKTLVGDKPFTQENVEAALTAEATRRLHGDHANSLDWRHSIVDLFKILNLDSSWDVRENLAVKMGFPGEPIKDNSFEMNVWLHRAIFNLIANEYSPSDS